MAYKEINSSLAAIERKLNKANKIAAKGSSITYKDAIKLGSKSSSISSTIHKGVKEYSGFNPTEDEARKLLAQMTIIVNLTDEQLGLLVQNKEHFNKLKVGGLVKRNVAKNEEAAKSLAKIMLAKAPASIEAESRALESRVSASFAKVVAAFASATGGEDVKDEGDDSD